MLCSEELWLGPAPVSPSSPAWVADEDVSEPNDWYGDSKRLPASCPIPEKPGGAVTCKTALEVKSVL